MTADFHLNGRLAMSAHNVRSLNLDIYILHPVGHKDSVTFFAISCTRIGVRCAARHSIIRSNLRDD